MADLLGLINSSIEFVVTLNNILSDVKRQCYNFKQNRSLIQKIQNTEVELVKARLLSLQTIFRRSSTVLSESAKDVWEAELTQITITLTSILSDVEELSQSLRPASVASSSFWQRARRFSASVKDYRHANEFAEKANNISDQLKEFSSLLFSRVDKLDDKLLYFAASSSSSTTPQSKKPLTEGDIFKPDFSSAPMPSQNAVINFSDPNSVEGALKQNIVDIANSSTQTISVATGISGMGGIGKTTALIALAYEKSVQMLFPDGIYFCTVGKAANNQVLVNQLSRIVVLSGGKQHAVKVSNSKLLEGALDLVIAWFKGRTALFIFDDIWETTTSAVGYLSQLKAVLRCSPSSHLVISTRSQNIARFAGKKIVFCPLQEKGETAKAILLQYTGIGQSSIDSFSSAAQAAFDEILHKCGGVRLTIAVAGSSIRALAEDMPQEEAIMDYEQRLSKSIYDIALREIDTYPNFNKSVASSLDLADRKDARCSNLFKRFCVLQKQIRVEMSIIEKIFLKVSQPEVQFIVDIFVDYHLVIREYEQGITKFRIHDLVLDFCTEAARHTCQYELFHRSLLTQFTEVPTEMGTLSVAGKIDENDIHWVTHGEGVQTRPWWDVTCTDQQYLFSNLAQHLVEGKLIPELVGLLSDARWTSFRLETHWKYGGIVSFISDIDLLITSCKALYSTQNDPELISLIKDVILVKKTVHSLWSSVSKRPAELKTQIHAYLANDSRGGWFVRRYVSTSTKIGPSPWLRPLSNYFHVPLRCEAHCFIPVTGPAPVSIASFNWTTKRMLVSTGYFGNLWLADITTGNFEDLEIEEHMLNFIADVGWSANGRKFVTAANGEQRGTIYVYNIDDAGLFAEITSWKLIECPEVIVTCVALNDDGSLLVSGGLDFTIRLWDTNSNTLLFERLFSPNGKPCIEHVSDVDYAQASVSVSDCGRWINYGTRSGTVYFIDRITDDVKKVNVGDEEGLMSISRLMRNGSSIKFWLDSMEETRLLELSELERPKIFSMFKSVDGKMTVAREADGTLNILDSYTGCLLKRVKQVSVNTAPWHSISADGQEICFFDRNRTGWISNIEQDNDIFENKNVFEPDEGDIQDDIHSGKVLALSISEDGSKCFSLSTQELIVWESATGQVEQVIEIADGLIEDNGLYKIFFDDICGLVTIRPLGRTLAHSETRTPRPGIAGVQIELINQQQAFVQFSADIKRFYAATVDGKHAYYCYISTVGTESSNVNHAQLLICPYQRTVEHTDIKKSVEAKIRELGIRKSHFDSMDTEKNVDLVVCEDFSSNFIFSDLQHQHERYINALSSNMRYAALAVRIRNLRGDVPRIVLLDLQTERGILANPTWDWEVSHLAMGNSGLFAVSHEIGVIETFRWQSDFSSNRGQHSNNVDVGPTVTIPSTLIQCIAIFEPTEHAGSPRKALIACGSYHRMAMFFELVE